MRLFFFLLRLVPCVLGCVVLLCLLALPLSACLDDALFVCFLWSGRCARLLTMLCPASGPRSSATSAGAAFTSALGAWCAPLCLVFLLALARCFFFAVGVGGGVGLGRGACGMSCTHVCVHVHVHEHVHECVHEHVHLRENEGE